MAPLQYLLIVSLGLLPALAPAQQAVPQNPAGAAQAPNVLPHNNPAHYQPAVYSAGANQLLLDLQRNAPYPAAALRAQASGMVLVSFVVEADGSVDEAKIVKSPSPLLDEAVVQAVGKLQAFVPARQDGHPVRSTFTCPVNFRIVGSSTVQRPLRPVTPLPRGPVQPLVASPTGNILVEKLIGFRDSLYWTGNEAYWLEKNRSKRVSAFQHYFTYDHLGRPATHTQESWASGKLLGTQQWRYEYGENGRLAAKVGKWSKFAFQYGKDGRLSRITAFALLKQQWEMVEETLLTEKSPLKNGSRIITLSTNNKRSGTLENYCTIDYTVAADNAILASTVYRYSYRPCAAPAVYTFAQDQQANPLRDLYLEGRYYQFEFERSSPHSLLSETQNGKSFKATAYRYNEAGNPMYGIVRNSVQQPYRDYTFTYAKIEVPAPPRAAGLAANSAGLLSIYPNPATTSAVISGAGIGPGEATLRIFTTSGQLHRQATYKATGSTLTETISVVGMEKGVYIVEVSGSHAVVKGKLVVE